jgi:hypothetical protein
MPFRAPRNGGTGSADPGGGASRGGALAGGGRPLAGHPYGELGDEGALRREADRFEDLRLLALEERIEADLQRIESMPG